jgi:hypothetical protein
MKKLLLLACVAALCACSSSPDAASPVKDAWSFYNANYDREMSVSTSADGKPQVSYTIKPKQQTVMSDAQVKELMAHFAKLAPQDGKAVVTQEAAK